jgi:hypothetical protein
MEQQQGQHFQRCLRRWTVRTRWQA